MYHCVTVCPDLSFVTPDPAHLASPMPMTSILYLPISLIHNLGQLAGLIHGAHISAANSDLYFWRQKLSFRDAGSQLGLANTCHWSNCLDGIVLAATALVSDVGFCNSSFFAG